MIQRSVYFFLCISLSLFVSANGKLRQDTTEIKGMKADESVSDSLINEKIDDPNSCGKYAIIYGTVLGRLPNIEGK